MDEKYVSDAFQHIETNKNVMVERVKTGLVRNLTSSADIRDQKKHGNKIMALAAAFGVIMLLVVVLTQNNEFDNDNKNAYGGEQAVWDTLYDPNTSFGGVSSLFSDLVDQDVWRAKVDFLESNKSSENLMSSKNYYTILSFIQEFNISKEVFEEANWSAGDEFAPFTADEINLLYSGDINKILDHFITPYVILHGNEAYTLEWFEKNPLDAWSDSGITPQEIQDALEKANSAKAKPSQEKSNALSAKIQDYINQLKKE